MLGRLVRPSSAVSSGRSATGGRERGGDVPRAGSEQARLADRGTHAVGVEPTGWESDPGPGDLDPPGDLGLVASERDGHDRDTVRKRLLGDAHAGVAHE